MSDFDKFWEIVKTGVEQVAKKTLQVHLQDAVQDGKSFLEKTKEDLKRWTYELAAGQLSQADFEDLVQGQRDLAEMESLKQAGLALAEIDRFVNGVISLVIDAAFKVFL